MYKVTKRSPTKVISEHYWADELRAQIVRDAINSQCDEYSGAVLEKIEVPDLEEFDIKGVEVELTSWPIPNCLSDMEVVIYLSDELSITCDIEAGYELNVGSAAWFTIDILDIKFSDSELMDEVSFEPDPEVRNSLTKFLTEYVNENDTFCEVDISDVIFHNQAFCDDLPHSPNTL